MNDKVKRVLSTLTLSALVATNAAVLMPKVANAAGVDVVAGEDRYATADAINAELGTEFENVVLASGYEDAKVDNTVDALTAAPLAHALNAPIVILNHKKVTPQDVVNKVKGLGAQNVYIATGVFGKDVVAALKAEGLNVVELGGKDRFETAYKIAKQLEKVAGTPSAAVVVNGLKKADAISIAPIAAAKGWPIILATQNDVNDTYKGNYEQYFVIGGTGVLSDAVVNEVNGERLAGKDRYSTNAEIVARFKDELNFDNVYVAKGGDKNLIDSLVGAVLAARTGSAIVLVNDRISEDAANVLAQVPAVKNAKYTVFGKAVNVSKIEEDAKYIADIAQEEQVTVKSVKALDDIKVKVGTKVEDLKLPTEVAVELTDGTTTNTMVNWDTTAYNATKAGTYKLQGSLVGYTTDLKAAVNVVVEEEAALKVEEVSANNLKNIVVKFNREVEKKSITSSNVKLYDGTTVLTGVTLNLLDDNKTLLITNNGTYTQLKEYKVVVENVELKGDATKKVEKAEKTVKVVDTTLPTVESVAVKSPKTLEITFSEPIKDFPTNSGVYDKVKINGINTYFASIDASKLNTENKVTVTLGTALAAGDHKVKVSGLNDYASLPVAEKEFTVNVPEDKVAPEVTAVEVVNKNKVKVTFSEPVDDASVVLANVKVNNTAVTAKSASEGGKVYEFTLGSSLDLASLVEVKLEYKGIKDNYGNEVKDAKTFTFKAVDDTTAPTVTEVKVNSDNTVEVTFSEDVTGFNSSAVELYDKDNKKVNKTIAVAQKTVDNKVSDKVYVLTIQDKDDLSGAYSIKILKDKVADLSIRGNKAAESTHAITLKDLKKPSIVKVEYVNETTGKDFNNDGDVFDSKVTIFFDEAMDAATLTDKANYILNNKPFTVEAPSAINVASDNKSVTFVFNKDKQADQVKFDANTDLRVLALKDLAGNVVNSVNTKLTLSEYVSNPAFNTVVDKVEAVAKNQIKIYAKDGYTFTSVDPNKIKFKELSALQVTAVSIASDAKTAVLTLNNNLTDDVKYDNTVVKLNADADAIVLGNEAKTQAVSDFAIADKLAPNVSKATYTVSVDNKDVDLTISADGKTLTADISAIGEAKKVTVKAIELSESATIKLLTPFIASDVNGQAIAPNNLISKFNTLTGGDGVSLKVVQELAKNDGDGDENTLTITGKLIDNANNENFITIKVKVK